MASRMLCTYACQLEMRIARAKALPLRWFSRRKKRVEYPEVREEWERYREDMSRLRKQIGREWRDIERTKQEVVSAQAAEEARTERMLEQKGLEDNEKELARMAAARAKRAQERVRHMEAKRVRGQQEREKVQQHLESQMKEELVKQTVESGHFITMETLDAAISHALENPVSYEYALKPSGEKARSHRTQQPDS